VTTLRLVLRDQGVFMVGLEDRERSKKGFRPEIRSASRHEPPKICDRKRLCLVGIRTVQIVDVVPVRLARISIDSRRGGG